MIVAVLALFLFLFQHQSNVLILAADPCFPALFAFGDSLTDTGNAAFMAPPDAHYPSANPPYGETFFHHPTGRFSDGQIFVDFFGQAALGRLPGF